jgi:acetyltransferase-like isoleucine patch superfamily enzyme
VSCLQTASGLDEALIRDRLRSLYWSIMDPVLRRVALRMELLQQQQAKKIPELILPAGVTIGSDVHVNPSASFLVLGQGVGSIEVGDFTHVQGMLQTFWNGGRIRVGNYCYIGAGTRIWSQSSIRIGDHVLISHLVDIHDTDSHPKSATERRLDAHGILQTGVYKLPTETRSAPIVIEDDVWIGAKATILKGVTIGKGAIVATGAMVTRDVDSFTIVAGNPARVVGVSQP